MSVYQSIIAPGKPITVGELKRNLKKHEWHIHLVDNRDGEIMTDQAAINYDCAVFACPMDSSNADAFKDTTSFDKLSDIEDVEGECDLYIMTREDAEEDGPDLLEDFEDMGIDISEDFVQYTVVSRSNDISLDLYKALKKLPGAVTEDAEDEEEDDSQEEEYEFPPQAEFFSYIFENEGATVSDNFQGRKTIALAVGRFIHKSKSEEKDAAIQDAIEKLEATESLEDFMMSSGFITLFMDLVVDSGGLDWLNATTEDNRSINDVVKEIGDPFLSHILNQLT